MKITKRQIQAIGNKISKRYGVPSPIVENKKSQVDGGCKGYKVRTELPSYEGEGGFEFQEAINKIDNNVIVESQGGCIYFIYEP